MFPLDVIHTHRPPLRVMSLRALGYCRRLFYLEEVENIHLANLEVYSGRELHAALEADEAGEYHTYELASDNLGLIGKVDCLRRRDGQTIPYEHKRGRPAYDADDKPIPWPGDRLQIIAYALLLEEALQQPIVEGRIRYHAANITVRVPIDEQARNDLQLAIAEAHKLRESLDRPPVTDNPRQCERCSLAPVCLPEEIRQHRQPEYDPKRLFPPDRDGATLHIVTTGASVGVSGDVLVVRAPDQPEQRYPIHSIESILLHGFAHISNHALRKCVEKNISVHWLTTSGYHLTSTVPSAGQVQRRIRQYKALTDPSLCLRLARQLALAKVESQYRYLMRASRGDAECRDRIQLQLNALLNLIEQIHTANNPDSLRGIEGMAAVHYFAALRQILTPQVPEEFRSTTRTRRPPLDRFNALLSYGYGLLHTAVMRAVLAVGLEPAFGFFHTPRSAAYPLVLDLMELFRVTLWDMPLVGSLNRGQWDPTNDFQVTTAKVWLSEPGRKKAITLFENRLQEMWKHPILNYSLSYARTIELEVRLLEKEWTGEPGLFAQARIR